MRAQQRPRASAPQSFSAPRFLTPPSPPHAHVHSSSNSAMGCFYEGYMTAGDTTDATDEAVQANIVAARYSLV